MLDSVALMLL